MADAIADHVRSLDDRPYALFGHSMGALLAFEVAVRMQRAAAPAPLHLLVSGRRGPSVPHQDPLLRGLRDEVFVDELNRRYGGIPAEVTADPDLLALLLPIVRADIVALETHSVTQGVRLDCPVSAFGGFDDRHASGADLAAWAVVARGGGPIPVRQFAGGHFYLAEQRPAVLGAIARALAAPANANPHIAAE